VPFGLIVNELISNSLKHGIEDQGTIRIHSKWINNTIIFDFQDNGIGFQPDYHNGFGLELIESLSDQIDGQVSFDNNPEGGVHIIITFAKA
jgi:two-component sensor histidine kinase